MTTIGRTRWVIVRDMLIFQVKPVLDGVEDLVFAPLALAAAVLDLFLPTAHPGERLYGVLRVGERFDSGLSLFDAAKKADVHDDGLFGASRAGAEPFLGRLEKAVLGYEEAPVAGDGEGRD